MVAFGNMLLNGDHASDLAQILGQVARNVVLRMTTAQELHVVYADKARATILATGLLLAIVKAGSVKPLTWLRA